MLTTVVPSEIASPTADSGATGGAADGSNALDGWRGGPATTACQPSRTRASLGGRADRITRTTS